MGLFVVDFFYFSFFFFSFFFCLNQSTMKPESCVFSHFKIYPGHGSRFVQRDSKAVFLLNTKNQSHYKAKKNPRRFAWTVLYRRLRKKGQQEETQRKRTRKVAKFTRSIVGADADKIKELRNQRPEQRKAAREEALREIKAKKAAKASSSKGGKKKGK